MENRYIINAIPVAQGRPRFTTWGGKPRAYDPKKSVEWKKEVKKQLKLQHPTVLEGALALELVFNMPRPKSLPKKVKHHTKKPDVDNLVKGVKDAMNGLCYKDDSQVIELLAIKQYSDVPSVIIRLTQIEEVKMKISPIEWLGVEVQREEGVVSIDYKCMSCEKKVRECTAPEQLEQKGMLVCPNKGCEAKYYKHNFSAGSHGVMSVWLKEEDVVDVRDERIKFKVKAGIIYCEGYKRKG